MRKKENGAIIIGIAADAICLLLGYVLMAIPIWLAWIGIGISTIVLFYGFYLSFSPTSKKESDTREVKQKILKRISAHVKHSDGRIYVLIKNKECRIDINCTNITVYKVNSLDRNHISSYSDIEDVFNSFFAIGDTVLTPYAKNKDVIIPVNHRDKKEVDLLAMNSSENRLEFKTIAPRNPLNPGLYGLVLGFTVYPQKESYKDFNIYITARIDYHGGSDLELWELRNARTKE